MIRLEKLIGKHCHEFGPCGGQVVSLFAFYPDDPSSIPADAYFFL